MIAYLQQEAVCLLSCIALAFMILFLCVCRKNLGYRSDS